MDEVARDGQDPLADRAQLAATKADGMHGDLRRADEAQLRENLRAVGWNLTPEQAARLDAASATPMIYQYWHQRGFERNPFPTS